MVRKHPHVKALTKQPTWKVKHFRSSNYRSSSPETAAAQVPSMRSRAAWSPPSPLSLNGACLVLRCYQVWLPLLGAGSKAPHDGVCVTWEVKGLRKPKARFSVLGATHISHAWAGWRRGQEEAASSVQTNNWFCTQCLVSAPCRKGPVKWDEGKERCQQPTGGSGERRTTLEIPHPPKPRTPTPACPCSNDSSLLSWNIKPFLKIQKGSLWRQINH